MDEAKPLKIMLVDDEAMLVRLGTRVMERLGHEVAGFTDPEEAAGVFESDPDAFDLIVTDYSMPTMSGLEFAQLVCDQAPEVPVVLVTGFGDMADDSMPGSIKKLLPKPFTMDQLRDLLGEFEPRH